MARWSRRRPDRYWFLVYYAPQGIVVLDSAETADGLRPPTAEQAHAARNQASLLWTILAISALATALAGLLCARELARPRPS